MWKEEKLQMQATTRGPFSLSALPATASVGFMQNEFAAFPGLVGHVVQGLMQEVPSRFYTTTELTINWND